MSHFTNITTRIRDIHAVRKACEELGLKLAKDTEARGYAGNSLKGEYVIKLNGPYDVALNKNGDGCFELTADHWNGHVAAELGDDFSKLKQLYGVHKTTLEARKRGLSVRRQLQQNGAVKLTLIQASIA